MRVNFLTSGLIFAWSAGIAMLGILLFEQALNPITVPAFVGVATAWLSAMASMFRGRCPQCDAPLSRFADLSGVKPFNSKAFENSGTCRHCGLDWMYADVAPPIRTSPLDRYGRVALFVFPAIGMLVAVCTSLVRKKPTIEIALFGAVFSMLIPVAVTVLLLRMRCVCIHCGQSAYLNSTFIRRAMREQGPGGSWPLKLWFASRCLNCGKDPTLR